MFHDSSVNLKILLCLPRVPHLQTDTAHNPPDLRCLTSLGAKAQCSGCQPATTADEKGVDRATKAWQHLPQQHSSTPRASETFAGRAQETQLNGRARSACSHHHVGSDQSHAPCEL